MSEDMFDLGDETEEQETDGEEQANSESESRPLDTSTTSSMSTEDEVDPLKTPAFAYNEELNRTIYVRDTHWSQFTNMTISNVAASCYEDGVEDVTKREIHDAVIQLANENKERLVELIQEMRQE